MSDIEQRLREAMDGVTPGPWDIRENTGLDEMWCDWHDVGPKSLTGGEADADSRYIALCSPDNIGALLDTIASLRSKLEEAEGALLSAAGTLEGLSYIHDSSPSDAMADMPAVEYARHMLYEARQIARSARSEARRTLASLREADHA